mgnify:CR=1 FL=1
MFSNFTKNMNYFDILLQTWKTLWKHKAILGFGLMIFLVPGIFLVLLVGAVLFMQPEGYAPLVDLVYESPYVAGAAYLGIGLIWFLVTVIGYTGIVRGTVRAEQGAGTLAFATLWEEAWPFVGRVTGLLLLLGVGVGMVFTIPAFLGVLTAGVAFLCLLPVIFLMFPLALLVQAFTNLSIAAAVADEAAVIAALKRGWQVLKENFMSVALMALILYMIQVLLSFLISLPVYAVQFLPLASLPGDFPGRQAISRTLNIAMLFVFPIVLALNSLVMTYLQSAWTLTYLRLTRPAAAASAAVPAGPADLSV